MSGTLGRIYIFGEWQLNTRLYELRCAGKLLKLEPKVFDVLLYLIEHRDRVVASQELMEHVWSGQHIGGVALARYVVAARRAIGDSGKVQLYIKTLRKRGYRFVAPVLERIDASPDEHTRTTSLPSPSGEGQRRDQAGRAPAPIPPPQQAEKPLERRVSPPQTTVREGHIPCPQCRHEHSVTASFCGTCGTRLVWVCPACGHREEPGTLFCTACGTRLTRSVTSTSPFALKADSPAMQVGSGEVPSGRTANA